MKVMRKIENANYTRGVERPGLCEQGWDYSTGFMWWSALTGSWHDCKMSTYTIKLNGFYCSSVAETKGTRRDSCALNCEKCQSLSHVQLCNSMNCYKPGSSVHRILEARILEWVAIPFTRGSSWPRDQTLVSCIVGRFFTAWTAREAQCFPLTYDKRLTMGFPGASLVAQMVKRLSAMQETQVQSLGWEDPL